MHDPKIIEARQVSNEYVSYRVVCCGRKCGDNCTPSAHVCEDSWHTMHISANHEEILEGQRAAAADRCEAMRQWREKWLSDATPKT